MSELLYLIVLFPLIGFLVNGLLGRWLTERQSGLVASLTVAGSFLISAWLLLDLLTLPEQTRRLTQTLFTWIPVGDLQVHVTYVLDPLSAVMVLVITGVGLLIHIYSIGYMRGDPGVRRYFAYLNLFMFMMLNLVLSDNLVVLFLGWEGVGLCSYLLIGFWFSDESKARAGMKAFIVNRIGDAAFIIAMIMLFNRFGTLSMGDIAWLAPGASGDTQLLTTITMLLFIGAVGKSAQVPLYVWLPDAMAGPTPVSALIHAATMVTAGVYLIARNAALFSLAPVTMATIAIVGVITALFAATIAVTQNDIKKVLAYSTISQLGYMFMALGTGAFGAAVFHLMTHAFFKALLFLGAGSVIHGMGDEQDMRKMGNLRHAMPITFGVMLVGVLAISGIPGLSGFFSKDEILWAAFEHGGGVNLIYLAGLLTAGLTAFYMSRMLFMTFFGQSRWADGKQPHESPSVMTVPLIILAFLAIAGGYLGVPEALGGHNLLHHFLSPVLSATAAGAHMANEAVEMLLMLISVGVAGSGIYLAFRIYIDKPETAVTLQKKFPLLHRLSANKFYVDELYRAVIVRPYEMVSELFWKGIDVKLIDAAVNGAGRALSNLGGAVRMIQTGRLQHYASMLLLGVAFILIMIMAS